MNSISNRNKVFRIVIGVVILITCVVIGMATTVVIQASGGSPLPDYISKDTSKELGTSENPYTILEIVPDVNSATVGYLINGCEPNNLLAIGATDSATSIYEGAFATDKSPTSTVGDKKDAFVYKQDQSSIGKTPSSGFMEKSDTYKGPGQPGTDMAYSEFGYFTRVTNETGNYNYNSSKKCFVPANGGNFSWTCVGEFQYVGYGNVPNGSISCSRALDFGLGGERKFSYDYSSNTGAIGSDAYNYYYTPTGDFAWVPNNNYNNENIFMENQTEITYVEDDKTKTRPITSAKVGDKLYMTRTENVYYVYEASAITVNDLLLKELVTPDTTALNYKTQVVTVTPEQLVVDNSGSGEDIKAKDLIDTADAIIIHDSETGYKIAQSLEKAPAGDVPKFMNINNGSKDLTSRTAEYIIGRGAKGYVTDIYGNVTSKPAAIMFDEDAIKTANSYGAGHGDCPNLKLVYDVYNNLGAKLAYNWMSGQQYSAKVNAASGQAGYRNFSYDEVDALGKSQFVYNFQGNDDSWLTTGFAYESKISKSNLNEPAFNNVDVGSTMSVAKMFSAINKESNGYNQPRKLRILEIEPNEKYYFDANNKDSWVYYYLSLFPWYIGTGKDVTADRDMTPTKENPADITVTTMPTYEFIGKNDDVNENYDLILVGCKEQDETNGLNGYNDTNNLTWEEYQNPSIGGHGLWTYDGTNWRTLAYTAVGDLITTFGGDEVADAGIEDLDNNKSSNTDTSAPGSSNYSYKWNYGLFRDNRWYNTRNAYVLKNGKTYDRGFARDFVVDVVGDGKEVLWSFFSEWTWVYQKTKNTVFGTKHGSDANMIGLRYSGNDLTKKKFDQLLDFSTQAPVIVDNNMYYDETSADKDKANEFYIDKSSFVYKLANKNTDDSTVYKYARGIDCNSKLNKVKSLLTNDSCSATFTNTLNGKDGLPKEYVEGADVNYNQQTDTSGNNVLQYHFVLNGNEDASYGINVYTDSNGNGIFEGCINHEKERKANDDTKPYDTEKSSNLIIFDETSKADINDGVLYSGHTYLVTKILPDSELGMVPWKLEIYKRDNDSIRFSEEGYTRIKLKNTDQKKEIKVLQMNTNADMSVQTVDKDVPNRLTCNFANHYRYTLDYDWWGNPIPNAKSVNNQEMSNLLNVEDFNITVDFMDNPYWNYVYGSDREKWAKALMEYDMLIIGFADCAEFTNNENYIYGFEKFREAGKSIILSHDLCQDTTFGIVTNTDNYNTSKIVQSDARYYLRDISGQLRKYYDAETGSNDYSYLNYKSNGRALTFEPSDNFKIYTFIRELKNTGFGKNNVDYLMQDESNMANTPIYDKHTYTYGIFTDPSYTYDSEQGIKISEPIQIIRDYYASKGNTNKPAGILQDNSLRSMLYYSGIKYNRSNNPQYSDKLDRAVDLDRSALVWQTKTFGTTKVQSVNEGQITKYPYYIPQTIDVAQTHMQNYQLDLEYDDEGDALIWYNLTGNGIYKGRNQDCRNNFYIYTKGNVTYTGLGHGSGMSEYEKKLFVNTMIAAYRSGAADPYIRVTNPDAVNNGNTTTLYVEDRDNAGSNTAITYRINDDTTNSKIIRSYKVNVYKNGSGDPIITEEPANLTTDYSIPVSYSEVKSGGEVKYRIVLESTYDNDQGIPVTTRDERNVNVVLMPMFDLR